ncbi:hypothetical protein PVAP13_1KG147377 [Panicum virgatum]|uniref:Uncharacterized protein n=1 Tax=Panicum virgatum TaxID=38727 RepID=A0A8T0X734_PANVG|nr:hypothetical protein PVAP13_1KG147377 [Panicum virgatum]
MAITLANSRNDLATIRDALEVSAEMYRKDPNNVQDYVQRHLLSLSVWEKLRFWDVYFEYLMENCSNKSANYITLVTTQLIVMATHMAGLGLPDIDSWNMIEKIAERNNLGYKQLGKANHCNHMAWLHLMRLMCLMKANNLLRHLGWVEVGCIVS